MQQVWSLLEQHHPKDGELEHLLYSLLFLRVYAVKGVNSSICGVDAKTLRKWQWAYIKAISSTKLVSISISSKLVS